MTHYCHMCGRWSYLVDRVHCALCLDRWYSRKG
jgi:hypothetical protein